MPLAAANPQFAMMPVDYILADPKPQARPTNILGGEERVENVLQCLPVHAAARVRNRKSNPAPARLPIGRFPGADEQPSSLWLHGINGIGH